jgi:putative RecB family exonuclease
VAKKVVKLSATRISSFLRCKLKYWFQYHQRLPKVSNPSFKLGLAVHESLELAGKIWLEKEKFTKTDIKKILEHYDKVSVREGIDDMSIHIEGKELVKNRLNSFLSGTKLLGLETKFGFNDKNSIDIKTKDDVPLMGAIDKVEEIDEDTLLIVDYKTSKTAPTPDQLRTDVQLSIYDLVSQKLWPGYKRIILSLDLLKSDIVYTYRTADERAEFEDYLKVIHEEMSSFTKKQAKADLNIFCPWCDYKDYCETYEKACQKSNYEFLPILNYSDEQLVKEWNEIKSVIKILEGRERELGMVLMEKIKQTSENIMGEDLEVYVRQNSRTTYDLDTIYKLVPNDDFAKLVGINKKSVERYLNSNPAIKEKVMSTSTTNYTKPFLSTKKIKK